MSEQSATGQKRTSSDERSPYQKWLDQLTIEADIHGHEEPEWVLDDVLSGIIMAETMDEAFEASKRGPLSGQDLQDVEIRVADIKILHSTISSARFKFMAEVVGTRLDTAEDLKLRVGAPNVVALLWKARETGQLPGEYVIRGRDLGDGKTLLNLEAVPVRVA